MIEGHCFTNLDEYKMEEWPEVFAAIPLRGDRVKAASGKILRVVDITHTIMSQTDDGAACYLPYILVELHKRY